MALLLSFTCIQVNASAGDLVKGTNAGQTRREQLARAQELVSDPDPLARLSNLETIVNSGDPVLIQVALRIALTSDDPDLRGLAMRAYLTTHREVTFDIVLPEEFQKLYDAALSEPEKIRQLVNRLGWAEIMATNAGKIQLVVGSYKFPEDTGSLSTDPPSSFTLRGDRFSTELPVRAGSSHFDCFVEFRPTVKATFEGTLSCKQGFPQLGLRFEVF